MLGKSLIDSSSTAQIGDITWMLQQALAGGSTSLDFLIQAEENDSSVDGRVDMFSRTKPVQTCVHPSTLPSE